MDTPGLVAIGGAVLVIVFSRAETDSFFVTCGCKPSLHISLSSKRIILRHQSMNAEEPQEPKV